MQTTLETKQWSGVDGLPYVTKDYNAPEACEIRAKHSPRKEQRVVRSRSPEARSFFTSEDLQSKPRFESRIRPESISNDSAFVQECEYSESYLDSVDGPFFAAYQNTNRTEKPQNWRANDTTYQLHFESSPRRTSVTTTQSSPPRTQSYSHTATQTAHGKYCSPIDAYTGANDETAWQTAGRSRPASLSPSLESIAAGAGAEQGAGAEESTCGVDERRRRVRLEREWYRAVLAVAADDSDKESRPRGQPARPPTANGRRQSLHAGPALPETKGHAGGRRASVVRAGKPGVGRRGAGGLLRSIPAGSGEGRGDGGGGGR